MTNDTAVQPRIDNDKLVVVLQGITSGLTFTQLVKYLIDRGVEVGPSELPAYLTEANRYYAQLSQYARDIETGKAIERLQVLYANSLKIQDYKACLAIQKELNALMGLKDNSPAPHSLPRLEISVPASAGRKKPRQRSRRE